MAIIRKRRTREHIIADLSVNYFERQALLCGYSVERVRNDYGYDLFLFTYNDEGEIENGDIRIQLKATDHLPSVKTDGTFPFRISRSDLVLWLNELMRVILVVYNAEADVAYWLYIQQYFNQIAGFSLFTVGQTVTLYFPLTNILREEAIKSFSGFRSDRYEQRNYLV